MASELAELLLALHRSPRLRSFEAEGTWSIDLRARTDYLNSRSEQQNLGSGNVFRSMNISGMVGFAADRPTVDDPHRFEVWFAQPSDDPDSLPATRWRVDKAASKSLAIDSLIYRLQAAGSTSTTQRNLSTSRYPAECGPILDGALLCGDFEFADDVATVRHSGRDCWSAHARRRRIAGLSGFPSSLLDDFGCEDVEVLVDKDTGSLMRYQGSGLGKLIFSLDLSRFELDPAIPDEVFEVSPPFDPRLSELSGDELDYVEQWMAAEEAFLHGPAELFVPTGPPPVDEEDAMIDVGIVCEKIFELSDDGNDLAYVDGGENLGRATEQIRDTFGSPDGVRVSVELIGFKDATEARAHILIHHKGNQWPHSVRVIRVDGRWKVAREFIARLYSIVGIPIPPRV